MGACPMIRRVVNPPPRLVGVEFDGGAVIVVVGGVAVAGREGGVLFSRVVARGRGGSATDPGGVAATAATDVA